MGRDVIKESWRRRYHFCVSGPDDEWKDRFLAGELFEWNGVPCVVEKIELWAETVAPSPLPHDTKTWSKITLLTVEDA